MSGYGRNEGIHSSSLPLACTLRVTFAYIKQQQSMQQDMQHNMQRRMQHKMDNKHGQPGI